MQKKIPFLLLIAALLSTSLKAQFRYTFKDTTASYVSLPATATAVNGTDIWYGNTYTLPMPFAWSLDSFIQQSTLNLDLAFFGAFNDPNSSTLTGFTLSGADFLDRGSIDSITSLSPIRYITTGITPNRIFKVEIANAGFRAELDLYGTLGDSVSQQIWIYEGSSIIEMHYGPSKISHFEDYFDPGVGSGSVLVGLIQNLDFGGPSGTIYYLSGPPASISVQTVSLPNFPTNGLAAWPISGKVFRFTPKVRPNGISSLKALGNIKVYPNPASASLFVEGVSTNTKATLYSMLGQVMLQAVINGTQTLDIAALPVGIYKLILTDKTGVRGATIFMKE